MRLGSVGWVGFFVSMLVLGGCGPSPGLVLQNVSVLDVERGAFSEGVTIVVRGDRIQAVSGPGEYEPRRNDRVYDLTGLFVISGLWDMHVHLKQSGAPALPQMLSMGVTSVRDMGGDLKELRAWQTRIQAGDLAGPRMFVAGPMLETPAVLERCRASETLEPCSRTRVPVPTSADAESVVDSIANLGVDFLKIREVPSPEVYTAVVKAARSRGMQVVGHAPFSMDPLDAAKLGVASFEHASYPYPLSDSLPIREAIIGAFAASGIHLVPTLVAWQTNVMDLDSLGVLLSDSLGVRDPRRAVLPPRLLYEWSVDLSEFGPRAAGYANGYQGFIDRMSADLAAMYRGGVPLMVGTDLAAIGVFPGFSVHTEMEYLVRKVGLSPLEALEAATNVPAAFMGVSDSIGSVAVGRIADLVILGADPLEDIRNTREIAGVVSRGTYFDEAEILHLRGGVAPTADGDLVLLPHLVQ